MAWNTGRSALLLSLLAACASVPPTPAPLYIASVHGKSVEVRVSCLDGPETTLGVVPPRGSLQTEVPASHFPCLASRFLLYPAGHVRGYATDFFPLHSTDGASLWIEKYPAFSDVHVYPRTIR